MAGVDACGVGVAEGPPNVPKREDAGVSGTSPLNASGGSITVEGRNDGLGALGVLKGVLAGVLAKLLKDGVMSSSGGSPDVCDDELGVGGTATSAPSAGGGADALAVGVS